MAAGTDVFFGINLCESCSMFSLDLLRPASLPLLVITNLKCDGISAGTCRGHS